MEYFEIKLNNLGLNNPTTVIANDKILTTQGLDIKTLCDLWKWYYNVPPFYQIKLIMDQKLFNSTLHKSLPYYLSIQELFNNQGVICEVEDE